MAKIPTLNLSVSATSYASFTGTLVDRNSSGLTLNHKKFGSKKWLVTHFPFSQIYAAVVAADKTATVYVRSAAEPVYSDVVGEVSSIAGTSMLEAENQEGSTVIFNSDGGYLISESMEGPLSDKSSSKDKSSKSSKSKDKDKKKGTKPVVDEDEDAPKKSAKGKDDKKKSKKKW